MKVIIITSKLGEKNGWGRYSFDMVNLFEKRDFDVLVLCHKKNDAYKHIKQIEILSDPLLLKRNQIFSVWYVFLFLLKNKGFKKADFIHCFVEPYSFFAYLLSKVLNIKYFITIHGSYGVKGFDIFLYKFLQLFSYERAKKIICVSNYTKNRVLKYKKLKNIKVIHNGVGEMSGKPTLEIKKENVIMGLGSLKNRKGFHITLKALKLVKKQIPDIKYFIIGDQSDSNYFNFLKQIVLDSKLEKNVIFLGNASDDEVKRIYKKSKLFVLTPISDRYNFEGFGLVYLEANSYGLPVVGSDDNGGEDAIKNCYNGYLARANDIDDTAEKILNILKNDKLFLNMSQNAKKWSEEFRWKNIFGKYNKVYEE